MSRRPPPYPRKPHKTGKARIKVDGRDVYLAGSWGSPESYADYERKIAEWRAALAGRSTVTGPVRTVGDLLDRLWGWVERRYRTPEGEPSGEAGNYRDALRGVYELYEDTPVQDFGPVALKAVRQKWVDAGISRGVVNGRVKRVQRAWREAVADELIPEEFARRLAAVSSLPIGTPGVTDYDEVPPVPEIDLTATIPELGPVVRAMVELQLLTGARPGEIVRLRPCDLERGERVDLGRGRWLDTGGKVWVKVFRRFAADGERDAAGQHKNLHRGHARILLFGPKAQEVLRQFLDRAAASYCFRPAESIAAHHAGRAAARRTPRQPSQTERAAAAKPRKVREHYTVDRYGKAIARAAKRAGVPHWHPHQLRHNAATFLVAEYGWEVARLILGHKTLATTRRYGQDPLANALPVVLRHG